MTWARTRGRLAAVAAGTLPALAQPAPSWWWLAWFATVPLILLVRTAPTAWDGPVRAWCGMGGYVLVTQYWLLPSAGPLLVVMAACFGALWLPWGWAVHGLLRSPISTRRVLIAAVVLPSAWVTAEAVRSWPGLGGAWVPLGASQWNQPVTLASAAVGGVWLTSFLVAAANAALAAAVVHPDVGGRFAALAVAAACVAAGPAWFLWGPGPHSGQTIRVALVQPGTVEASASREQQGEELTGTLTGRDVDLVVWGESSVGVDLASHPDAMRRLVDLARRIDAYLLVNVDARAPEGGISKSAVLIGPAGPLGSYRKTRLVPFGEYVPLRALLGPVARLTKAAGEDRRRGSGPVILNAGPVAVVPLISYESTFSDLARRGAQLGGELLVYQSSTSSYQGSWAQPQLAAQIAVRAAEVGRPTVHAALSGDSGAFDDRGRILASAPSHYRGVIVVDVALASIATPYDRFGNWVLVVAFGTVAAAGLTALIRSYGRSERRSSLSGKRWPALIRAICR